MVKPQQMQNGRIQIMHVDRILGDIHTKVVRLAKTDAPLNASAGQPHGKRVFVVISAGHAHAFAGPLIERLSKAGVALNVTAVMSLNQVQRITECLALDTPAIISVFAGRIADTGRDPMPLMAEAVKIMRDKPKAELIWASPRELLNIFHADSIGCHIITATNDILKKLALVGKDLEHYSLDTVKMFCQDAQAAGYNIKIDD